MHRALFPKTKHPDGHPHLAKCIGNLGLLHKFAGEYGKAEPLYVEALDMMRALYPKARYPIGHADLATSINYLGALHRDTGDYGKAEPLFQEALDFIRMLHPKAQFPNGHPDLALSIINLGVLHESAGDYGKAEPLFLEALAMTRALLPEAQDAIGNPQLALSLKNLGGLYKDTGDYSKAEPLLREALEMKRALFPKLAFPDGHPDLALSIVNLAWLNLDAREHARAKTLLREALEMNRALLRRFGDLAAEAEALNFAASQAPTRDVLLSVTCDQASAIVYDDLWDSRALLTRLQEQRHRYLAASRDLALRDLADHLRLARLDLSRRLLQPLKDGDENRAELRRLTAAKEDLEKRLAAQMKLPLLLPAETPAPQRLAARLPPGTCFINYYRYYHVEQDPNVKGKKGQKHAMKYVAFVVRPGQGTARVELGNADSIEHAWAGWHKTITGQHSDEAGERAAATAVGRLIWEPLRCELPADLTTVYLSADAALHQLPWAALPGRKPGAVLLDEHAVCLVPHGPFLLQRLEESHSVPAGPAGSWPSEALTTSSAPPAPTPRRQWACASPP
jgi:tetratricopeptide (TPR) repeat protein